MEDGYSINQRPVEKEGGPLKMFASMNLRFKTLHTFYFIYNILHITFELQNLVYNQKKY